MTTVNIATCALPRDAFQNWPSMQSKEARRVFRPICIAQASLTFVAVAEKTERIDEIAALFETFPKEVRRNVGLQGMTPADLHSDEQLTNVELFMAYATYLVASDSETRADYEIYVRRQHPSPEGLPIEVHFFTCATDFASYHAFQRRIFSQLLALLPEFGLRACQR